MKFQYNDKKHAATGHTPFELNFRRYLWKGDPTIKIELPNLEEFLEKLQKSQDKIRELIEITKEAMKKQFNKKR